MRLSDRTVVDVIFCLRIKRIIPPDDKQCARAEVGVRELLNVLTGVSLSQAE